MKKLYNDIPRGHKDPNTLYNALQKLVSSSEFSFYKTEAVTRLGTKVEIFAHRTAHYDDWSIPYSRECRGIMFEVDEKNPGKVKRIMTRPLEKCFNWGELDMSTFPISPETIGFISKKEDGSIVSTYYDQCSDEWDSTPELFLKSMSSIASSVSSAAMQLINSPRYIKLKDTLLKLSVNGYTTNMEYVSPSNRIVLEYSTPELIIIDIRENLYGTRVSPETLDFLSDDDLYNLESNYVTEYENTLFSEFENGTTEDDKLKITRDKLLSYVNNTKYTEGLIIYDKINGPVKVKTAWYTEIHRVKSTISSNRNLFESIATGTIDDIRVLYLGDTESLNRIREFEEVYLERLDKNFKLLQRIHKTLNGLDRKRYALRSEEMTKAVNAPNYIFGLSMQMYEGEINWDYIIKRLSEEFLKRYRMYVPEKYKVEYDSEGNQIYETKEEKDHN